MMASDKEKETKNNRNERKDSRKEESRKEERKGKKNEKKEKKGGREGGRKGGGGLREKEYRRKEITEKQREEAYKARRLISVHEGTKTDIR